MADGDENSKYILCFGGNEITFTLNPLFVSHICKVKVYIDGQQIA
jgi:hypothetical protein